MKIILWDWRVVKANQARVTIDLFISTMTNYVHSPFLLSFKNFDDNNKFSLYFARFVNHGQHGLFGNLIHITNIGFQQVAQDLVTQLFVRKA